MVIITSTGGVSKMIVTFEGAVDPGSGDMGGGVPERAARRYRARRAHAASAPDRPGPVARPSSRSCARLAPAFGEIDPRARTRCMSEGTARLFSAGMIEDTAQINELMSLLERRVALLQVLRTALGEPGVYVRIGHENEIPAMRSLGLVATGYGVAQRKLGSGVGDRAGADGLCRGDRDGARGRTRAVAIRRRRLRRGMSAERPMSRTSMPRDPYEVLGVAARRLRAADQESVPRSSRGSCTRTSTRTIPRPRRSSRRPPRRTRSSRTPNGAPRMTAMATRV